MVIALGTVFMLMSVGGAAIYASPLLVPALWWAARSSGTWARAGLTFLAALVMAEVGWFFAYSAVREEQPYIILGPALAFVATIAGFLLTFPRRPVRERPD